MEADPRARREAAQPERVVVEDAQALGVGGQQNLEPAVETESVDEVGAHPAADPVGSLENQGLAARLAQVPGTGEARDACPDDHDLCAVSGGHGAR